MLYTNAGIMLLTDKHINANEDVRCIDPSFFCSSANMCLTKPGTTEPEGGGRENVLMRRSWDFVTVQCGDLGAPLRSPAYKHLLLCYVHAEVSKLHLFA